MKKDDVYKLIGYHGEYTASVKKALRKLLKENHPDNKGNREKFELINEVKKELEEGKVSYREKHEDKGLKDNSDIDYQYCYEMIDSINIKRKSLNDVLSQKKDALSNYEKEYKDLYQNSLDAENGLLINTPYVKKLQNIKLLSIVLVIIMIILFVLSLLKNNNTLFLIFIVLSIICILVIQEYVLLMHKITTNNRKRLTNYFKINSKIRRNISKQNELKEEIVVIKRKIVNLDNDLRFYKNLLK